MEHFKKYWWIYLLGVGVLILLIFLLKGPSEPKRFATGGTLEARPDGNHAINIIAPRPAGGSIIPGDTIEITGNVPFAGSYPVTKIWTDSQGNIGSIYAPISYLPTSEIADESFKGQFQIKY